MPAIHELKRQNFNVTPEQEAELLALQNEFASPSIKDAIFKAVRLALFLRQEVKRGSRLGLKDQGGIVTEIIMPEWEALGSPPWTYLVERPYSWKKQLFVKGRKLTAAQVWLDMKANQMTELEAAENWDLPVEAVTEIKTYCESHASLLQMEADEEKMFLSRQGIRLSA
jgi:hypothetical protein